MELVVENHQPRVRETFDERQFLAEARMEIAGYYADMTRFATTNPQDVFLKLSAFCARAAEIRSFCQDIDSRLCQAFRTKQVDPFLEACDMQFKLHSRIQAVRDMEYKLSGGAP